MVRCRTVLQLPLLELQLDASTVPLLLSTLQQPLLLLLLLLLLPGLLLLSWPIFDSG
jgi:hypothetical protein